MPRKPASTRFASMSDTLEAFSRTREVLGKVVIDPQFERNLYTADKPEQEAKREDYKALVSTAQFFESVKELHNVFRLCRRYLREFDKETGTTVADVVRMTEFLERALDKVPTSEAYLTDERMELIKASFRKRKDGPISGRGIQVRLIEDVHVAACLLHPTKHPADYQCYYQRFYCHIKRFVASALLPSCGTEEDMDEDALTDLSEARNAKIDKIMSDYERIHSRWRLMPPRDLHATVQARDFGTVRLHDEYAYRASSLRFWKEEMRTGNCPELCELALRTLSISPSSCAAERSFSAQGRISTKSRNRLAPDVIRKLMFVRWNIKHYDESLEGASSRSEGTDAPSQRNDTDFSDDDGMDSPNPSDGEEDDENYEE